MYLFSLGLLYNYCFGLSHASVWVSHRYACVPSLLSPPPISHPSHPSGLSQSTALSSLCYRAHSQLPICFAYGSVRISLLLSQFIPEPNLSQKHSLLPLLCPWVCSLCPSLYSCPANRFLSTVFLDSIYMH